MRLKNEDLPPSDRKPAQKMLEGITLWISVGSEESTFMECTECHKFFCPECVSVCPLCLDRMCHVSLEPAHQKIGLDPNLICRIAIRWSHGLLVTFTAIIRTSTNVS